MGGGQAINGTGVRLQVDMQNLVFLTTGDLNMYGGTGGGMGDRGVFGSRASSSVTSSSDLLFVGMIWSIII